MSVVLFFVTVVKNDEEAHSAHKTSSSCKHDVISTYADKCYSLCDELPTMLRFKFFFSTTFVQGYMHTFHVVSWSTCQKMEFARFCES